MRQVHSGRRHEVLSKDSRRAETVVHTGKGSGSMEGRSVGSGYINSDCTWLLTYQEELTIRLSTRWHIAT